MRGAVPPVPNAPSWRGAQLGGAQGQLYLLPLTLTLCVASQRVFISRETFGYTIVHS